MPLYRLPGKPLPYTLHSQFFSDAQYDTHGDVLREGGVLMGNFVRTTPSGTGKWQRAPMDAVALEETGQ